MRLDPLPDTFQETRDALHQIAFFAMAPARYAAVGRMGLTAAPGGFGTPRFDGKVARVEGDTILFETVDGIATQIISTVREAASFFGVEYRVDWYEPFHDPLAPSDPDAPLQVDDVASRALGRWFDFGYELLALARDHGVDATEIQLWPEHFDPAFEMGEESAGQKASYGASPGDAANPEPYLYVAPWGDIPMSGPFWNGRGFRGASLGHAELRGSEDPVASGLEFLIEGYRAVTG